MVRPKPFWTDRNCFGHIEGQGIRKKDRKKIETKTLPDFWTKLDNFSQSVAV